MFLFKSLGKLLATTSPSSPTDILEITGGSWYRLGKQINNVESPQRELILSGANFIVRSSTVPHHYLLSITPVRNENKTNDDDDLEEEEWNFLLDEEIHFGINEQEYSFHWDNIEKNDGSGFEFVVTDPKIKNSPGLVNSVQDVIFQCMYERKTGQAHLDIAEKSVREYIAYMKEKSKKTRHSSLGSSSNYVR